MSWSNTKFFVLTWWELYRQKIWNRGSWVEPIPNSQYQIDENCITDSMENY